MSINWDVDLIDQYEPPTEALFSEMEQRIGGRIPDDYREFLSAHNGGLFKNGAQVKTDLFENDGSDAALFDFACAIDAEVDKYYDIIQNTEQKIGKRVTEGMICIMHGANHYMALKTTAPDEGAVFLGVVGPEPHRFAHSFSDVLPKISRSKSKPQAKLPAFRAIETGDDEFFEQFLEEGGSPNLVNEDGTPLLSAASRQPQMVRALLLRGADIELPDAKLRRPLLHAATSSFDVVRILLADGADCNASDRWGITPLMFASDLRSFKALIKAGANINAREEDGETVFTCAGHRTRRHFEVLLEAGYDIRPDIATLRSKLTDQLSNFDGYELRSIRDKLEVLGSLAKEMLPELLELQGKTKGALRVIIANLIRRIQEGA